LCGCCISGEASNDKALLNLTQLKEHVEDANGHDVIYWGKNYINDNKGNIVDYHKREL
jgi:hypothetical protein